ncbi:dehydrin COR410-like isoform X2 [Humulus lupulus]|uniref:dehydrin COR410-like isoform X2 n=1 Tax=Humulus lupulus TaxID=3486 RepID=UPI002B4088AC|nr:dehydrin COR410-like isoform X2 [Humulus lupulus]
MLPRKIIITNLTMLTLARDEEEGNGEKRKKKGLKDKIKDKISGKKEGEHTDDVHATEKKTDNHTANTEAANSEEKGFLEKIKDKLPGQHKKAQNHGASADCGAEGHKCHEDDSKDKREYLKRLRRRCLLATRKRRRPRKTTKLD